MAFDFTECTYGENVIEGLFEVRPKIFGDARGYFFESYSERDFFDAGIKTQFVQDNESSSVRGVLRGLHFQTRYPQAKLVRVVAGKVFDVAVDLRNESPTFGKWHGVILDGEKKNQFYIPRGFAHGFYVMSETATFTYKCDNFYDPSGESGIIWNDASIGVNWNFSDGDASTPPILSEKDMRLPSFDKNRKYFSLDGVWIG